MYKHVDGRAGEASRR